MSNKEITGLTTVLFILWSNDGKYETEIVLRYTNTKAKNVNLTSDQSPRKWMLGCLGHAFMKRLFAG